VETTASFSQKQVQGIGKCDSNTTANLCELSTGKFAKIYFNLKRIDRESFLESESPTLDLNSDKHDQ